MSTYDLLLYFDARRVKMRKQNEQAAREIVKQNPEAIYEARVAGAAHLDPYGVFKPIDLLNQDKTRSKEQPKFSPGAIAILTLAAQSLDTLAGPILIEEEIEETETQGYYYYSLKSFLLY